MKNRDFPWLTGSMTKRFLAFSRLFRGYGVFHEFSMVIWVCLKMGYPPNYSHLVGIMISKTIGFFGVLTIFRQTHITIISPLNPIKSH